MSLLINNMANKYMYTNSKTGQTRLNLDTGADLADQKFLFDTVRTYAQAAVNLYGVISLIDFTALYNQQNIEKLTICLMTINRISVSGSSPTFLKS